jgi:hypothetical protein
MQLSEGTRLQIEQERDLNEPVMSWWQPTELTLEEHYLAMADTFAEAMGLNDYLYFN